MTDKNLGYSHYRAALYAIQIARSYGGVPLSFQYKSNTEELLITIIFPDGEIVRNKSNLKGKKLFKPETVKYFQLDKP